MSGYTLGERIPGVNNFAGVNVAYSGCNEAVRPGYISSPSASVLSKGLPGFAGGARRTRRGRGRKQRGGTYMMTGATTANGTAFNDPKYTGCGEGQYIAQNPLTLGDVKTLLTAPPAQVPNATPMSGGGALSGAPVVGSTGTLPVDAQVYNAPRAGYSIDPNTANQPGAGMYDIRTPYSSAPVVSGACVKTGGGRRSRKALRKSRKARKSRKNRKTRNSRNSRK